MSDWELILAMIGEKATTDITKEEGSQDFEECKDSAKEGGEVPQETRKQIEKRLGRPVISEENYLSKKTIEKI